MSLALRVARAVVTVLCLLSGSAHAQDARSESTDRPGFPPAAEFFARPQYSQFSLSPDGKLFAALVPALDRQNVALIDLDKGTAKLLTSFRTEDVFGYRWIGDRTLEVQTANISDAGGIRVRRTAVIDTDGNVIRDLNRMGHRGVASIIGQLDRDGRELIVQSYERNASSRDAYRYTPQSNTLDLLTFENPGDVVGYVSDRAGQVRIAVSVTKNGQRRSLWYRATNDEKWKQLRDDPIESANIGPIAFAFDNKTLYVSVREGVGGRSAIHTFDPETNAMGDRVYASPSIDAGALVFDEVRKILIGVRDDSRGGVTWLDPDWKRLQDSIDAALPDTRNRMSWARFDSSRIIVRTESDVQPPIFYLLDRTTHKLEEVAAAFPSLKTDVLSARRAVRYAARDGMAIPGHLTMPQRPDGIKPPLIVIIHGGPFVPSSGFGYRAEAQFFASRGYAVLEPDFRGTQGYGRDFEQAGWRQWGLAMQDDVTDGVKWLVDSGRVDADRVCLFGASYGGYATLWGLEKEPSMFRCGVAQVAVADLEMMFDVQWSDFMRSDLNNSSLNYFTRVLGDPDKDRTKLREVSPLYHADRIRAPLLLAYGAADLRVPLVHGNRMRAALDKYDKSYEWVVYNDEGHGFNKLDNKIDFYRRVDAFLAKHLAPRSAR